MPARITLLLLAAGTSALLGACSSAPDVIGSPSADARSSSPSMSGAATAVPTATRPPAGRNGVIVYSDSKGDIRSLDPRTGRSTLLIGGKHDDVGPGMLPGGRRFAFVRVDEQMMYTAAVDGSDVRPYADARQRSSWEISPDGRRIAQIPEARTDVTVVGADGGVGHPLGVRVPISGVAWLGDDHLLLTVEDERGSVTALWRVGADGTGLTRLTTPDICCDSSTFGPGALVAWNAWSAGGAQVHVMDTATGVDAVLASSDEPGATFFGPRFSPNGRWIAVSLFGGGTGGHQLALMAADGSGTALRLGPSIDPTEKDFATVWSPDGTRLLAVYDDGSSWLFELPSGRGGPTGWPSMSEATWQPIP